MNNFKTIYRILQALDRHKGDEDFDAHSISADALRISFPAWEQIVIELQRNGYIDGVVTTQTIEDKFPHIVEPIHPRITLQGMEYLADNNMMRKAANAIKTGIDIII